MEMSRREKIQFMPVILSLLMIISLAVSGCANNSDTSTGAGTRTGGAAGATAGAVNLAAGGTVTATAGALAGTQIVVPQQNAATGAATFNIEPAATEGALLGTRRIGPTVVFSAVDADGNPIVSFDPPVTISVPFVPGEIPVGTPAAALGLYTQNGDNPPVLVTGVTLNHELGVMTASVTHFSSFWSAYILNYTEEPDEEPPDGGNDGGGAVDFDSLTGVAARGEGLFTEQGCLSCHCADAMGGCAGGAPRVVGVAAETLDARLRGSETHPVKPSLADQDIVDLEAFLASLSEP